MRRKQSGASLKPFAIREKYDFCECEVRSICWERAFRTVVMRLENIYEIANPRLGGTDGHVTVRFKDCVWFEMRHSNTFILRDTFARPSLTIVHWGTGQITDVPREVGAPMEDYQVLFFDSDQSDSKKWIQLACKDVEIKIEPGKVT